MWGLTGIDKDGVGKWDPGDLGAAIWDENFNMASTANQQYLYDFCQSLRSEEIV